MRRLLLLVEGLGLRGADKIAVEWAKLFAQAGHEAVLGCCGASRGGVFGVEPPEGVEVVSGSPEEIVRAFPDAVVAINSSATALGALPILRGVAKRLVLIAHSAGTWVEPFVVGGAHKTWDAVVALSPHVAARLASFGIPTAKLWTIPALVQKVDRTSAARCGAREALGIPDGAFVVGYAGRADFQKGVPDLAVVLSGLVRRGVDARVLFAGLSDPTSPSPQQDQCRQVMRMFATQGGVLDRVVEMPATSDLEIFWQAIDAFALLSKTEGASLVLREAIACGVPVVATLAGDAHAWAVETEGSFVVPVYAGIDFERLENIAEKFATIARRLPEERERMSAQAERRAEPILRTQSKDVQTVRVLDKVLSTRSRVLPKILLLSDVRGWAFDVNLQDLAACLSDEFDFAFWYVADGVPFPHEGTYDAVYAPFHRWKVVVDGTLPMDRTLGSLRSRWFYAEVPVPPGLAEFALVNQFRAFHVVTRSNLDELKGACPQVIYLTNPVNMRRFPSPTPVHERVVASWNGNAQHRNTVERDVKGFYSIILPACAITKIDLEFAEYHIRRKAPCEMPEFYQLANLAVCASLYEGASNSVMEAMAAGQALLTTDVGNVREMQDSQIEHFGDTGIVVVDRTVGAFCDALERLKKDPARIVEMGRLNRAEIEARWSWDVWRGRYADFLRSGL